MPNFVEIDENVVYNEREDDHDHPMDGVDLSETRGSEAPAAVDEDENVEAFRADIVFPRDLEYSPGRVFALTAQPRGAAESALVAASEGRRKRRKSLGRGAAACEKVL